MRDLLGGSRSSRPILNRCGVFVLAITLGSVGSTVALVGGAAPAGAESPSSWVISSSPNPGSGNYRANELKSVSCTSVTSCMAVGYYNSAGPPYFGLPLVETWDGTAWTIGPSPDTGFLGGVSCTNSANCMVISTDGDIEHWNGASWTTDIRGVADQSLSGVSCTSPTFCVAVGSSAGSGSANTLVETWDGMSWSITPSPNPPSGPNPYNDLNGVSCSSPISCVAVGGQYGGYPASTPIVETWDGTSWSIPATPSTDDYSSLNGVSCTGSAQCVAVGQDNGNSLIEMWDGTAWSVAPGANPGGLSNVSCSSPDFCAAVTGGGRVTGTGRYGLGEWIWGGSTWTFSNSPAPGRSVNQLLGVACANSNYCAAVGDYANHDVGAINRSAATETLVETPFVIGTTSLPDATLGQPYSVALTASGGNAPYHWNVTGPVKLPKGLKLDKATGMISGIPTQTGTFALTVSTKDSAGTPHHPPSSTEANLVLTIDP